MVVMLNSNDMPENIKKNVGGFIMEHVDRNNKNVLYLPEASIIIEITAGTHESISSTGFLKNLFQNTIFL